MAEKYDEIMRQSLVEDLEDLFMKHKLQGFVSVYITSDNKIETTSFGKERKYLAYTVNKHINER